MFLGTTIESGTTAEPAASGATLEPKPLWIDIPSLRQPMAFVPIALSLAAFLLVLGNSIFLGMGHMAKGSTTDNIFHVLMEAQFPVVIFLIVRRLRRYPRETLGILAIQVSAALLAFSVDFILAWGITPAS